MTHKQRLSMSMAVALLTLTLLSCEPKTAFAAETDDTALDETVGFLAAMTGEVASEFWAIPGAPAVAAAIYGAKIALDHPIHTGVPVDMSSFTSVSGLYKDIDGNTKIGAMCAYDGTYSSTGDAQILIAYSDDFEIYVQFAPSSPSSTPRQVYSSVNSSGSAIYFKAGAIGQSYAGFITNRKNSGVYPGSYTTPSSSSNAFFEFDCHQPGTISATTPMTSIGANAFQGYSRPSLISQGTRLELPAGEADPGSYYNILYNWTLTNYPDCIYVFTTQPPLYPDPSDAYPGIPRDWTIINPDLPSIPSIDVQLPTVDFGSLPSVDALPSTRGVSFWWALTDEILTRSTLKWLYLAIAVVGIAIFAIWRIGS